jgi:hypothetical protein
MECGRLYFLWMRNKMKKVEPEDLKPGKLYQFQYESLYRETLVFTYLNHVYDKLTNTYIIYHTNGRLAYFLNFEQIFEMDVD